MTKTILRSTLIIGLAAAALTGSAEARGFGGSQGGFGGRGIAVGEPNPGMHHGGGFGHGGWGHGGFGHRGFGWRFGAVSFAPFYAGCFTKRFVDPFGNIILKRICD